jgi:hypothetical protein
MPQPQILNGCSDADTLILPERDREALGPSSVGKEPNCITPIRPQVGAVPRTLCTL